MNEQITQRLRTPIPAQLVKQLNGRDYISGHTAIDRLIQATGNDWSFGITNVVSSDGHVAMQGELTIAGMTRSAWGEARSQNNPSEELFKNAETDTLKRAARLFGVALELYGELLDEQTGEVTHRASSGQRPQNAPQARQRPAARAQSVPPDHALAEAQTSARAVIGDPDEFALIERTEILQALREIDDRRDLAGIKARLRAAGLDDDAEVTNAYNVAYNRLTGAQTTPGAAQQPSLVT